MLTRDKPAEPKRFVTEFDQVVHRRMEELEDRYVKPVSRKIAKSLEPWMDQVIDLADAILASEDFIEYAGELTSKEQRVAMKTFAARWADQNLKVKARIEAGSQKEGVERFFTSAQASCASKYALSWNDFLQGRLFRSRSDNYIKGVKRVTVTISDQDRENARLVKEPFKGTGAERTLLDSLFAFLEEAANICKQEIRQPRTIAKIRQEAKRKLKRARDRNLRWLGISLHMMAWAVINDTIDTLTANTVMAMEKDG